MKYKTGVINDPLGQPTDPAGSDCRLILKFWDGRTDNIVCVKIGVDLVDQNFNLCLYFVFMVKIRWGWVGGSFMTPYITYMERSCTDKLTVNCSSFKILAASWINLKLWRYIYNSQKVANYLDNALKIYLSRHHMIFLSSKLILLHQNFTSFDFKSSCKFN